MTTTRRKTIKNFSVQFKLSEEKKGLGKTPNVAKDTLSLVNLWGKPFKLHN